MPAFINVDDEAIAELERAGIRRGPSQDESVYAHWFDLAAMGVVQGHHRFAYVPNERRVLS